MMLQVFTNTMVQEIKHTLKNYASMESKLGNDLCQGNAKAEKSYRIYPVHHNVAWP